MNKQSGFTLIELIMVIVILGILAATAIPRFYDLSAEAGQAAADGVAGSLAAAAAINYAVRSQNAAEGFAIATCADTSQALQGGLPTGWQINDNTFPACEVEHTADGYTAGFQTIAIS